MTIKKLTLRQHQKLQALFDSEEGRLIQLRVESAKDYDYQEEICQELRELFVLKEMILSLPHENSHYKTMPKINCADKTIFTLRDQGDSTVGLAPFEMTLSLDQEVDPSGFAETLHLLYSLNDTGWCGPVTAYVEYQERQAGKDVTELKLQIEGYHPDRNPELTVRII